MDKDGFIGAILGRWREGEWMDMDGGDMEEIAFKYGITTKEPATEKDCKDWGYEYDVQPGDIINKFVPEAMKLMND